MLTKFLNELAEEIKKSDPERASENYDQETKIPKGFAIELGSG